MVMTTQQIDERLATIQREMVSVFHNQATHVGAVKLSVGYMQDWADEIASIRTTLTQHLASTGDVVAWHVGDEAKQWVTLCKATADAHRIDDRYEVRPLIFGDDVSQSQPAQEEAICPNCERLTGIRHCQACGCDFTDTPRLLEAPDDDTVYEVAKRIGVKTGDVIKFLFRSGIMATATQKIDYTAVGLIEQHFEECSRPTPDMQVNDAVACVRCGDSKQEFNCNGDGPYPCRYCEDTALTNPPCAATEPPMASDRETALMTLTAKWRAEAGNAIADKNRLEPDGETLVLAEWVREGLLAKASSLDRCADELEATLAAPSQAVVTYGADGKDGERTKAAKVLGAACILEVEARSLERDYGNNANARRKRRDAQFLRDYAAIAERLARVEGLEAVLREARRAIGDHCVPEHCYSTGPMTGNDYRDLVECPACSFIAMYDALPTTAPEVSK